MKDLLILQDNPKKKKRTGKKPGPKPKRRKTTARKKTKRTTRGTLGRKTTRRGSNRTVNVAPRKTTKRNKPQTTVGKSKSRRVYKAKRNTARGGYKKRRRSLGQGFTFNGVMNDMIAIATIVGGVISGGMLQRLGAQYIFLEKDDSGNYKSGNIKVQDALLLGLGTYGLSYAIEHYVKPSQTWAKNLITGSKVSGVITVIGYALQLLFGDKSLDSQIEIFQNPNDIDHFKDSLTKSSLLGLGAYYVDDTGEMYNLSGSRRLTNTNSLMGTDRQDYSGIDEGDLNDLVSGRNDLSCIDNEMSNLLEGNIRANNSNDFASVSRDIKSSSRL